MNQLSGRASLRWGAALMILASAFGARAAEDGRPSAPRFDRIVIVMLENTDFRAAIREPYLARLAASGALFQNFFGITHPSQGNYIALTAGSLHGVRGNGRYDLNVRHIGDLLEDKGLDWRGYADGYPGGCFTGSSSGRYVRRHNPFISFVNVQSNPIRCAKIVSTDVFDSDAAAGRLPAYSLYVPDLDNDGHDTGVGFASRWLERKFGPLLADESFMRRTLIVVTFDESRSTGSNQIYLAAVGPSVRPGSLVTERHDLFGLLRLVEDNWRLGDLGLEDRAAPPIDGIWAN